jgi:YD repeat-containing protein
VVNDTSRPLYPREGDPVAIVQEAGWAQGQVWTGAENLSRIEIQSPDRPSRSELLYQLRYDDGDDDDNNNNNKKKKKKNSILDY